MSVTKKSAAFLVLTFAISWAIAIGAHAAGVTETLGPSSTVLILVGMMTGPALAAFICVLMFEKGRRVEALGLRFKPNLWWLLAWLIPIVITYASLGATLLLTDQTYVDMGEATRRTAESMGQDMSQVPPVFLETWFLVTVSVTFGAITNAFILTFTEELGWRGYLYDLWRPSGFWRTAIATGLIWGLWHAPAVYFYGLNYPTEPVLGIGIFAIYCVPLAIIFTHVRERADSVWAAGIIHGTFNAVPGISIASLSNPEFPWTGIVGIGGFLVMVIGALIVAVLRMRGQASVHPQAAA